MPPEINVRVVRDLLRSARHICVITGAGISAESGIPTFRSAQATMGALWKDFDPQTLATPEAFEADPPMVQKWYEWRRVGCLNAVPNPGHFGLAALESQTKTRGGRFTLLTQNVDRLHQRAGSSNVVELHGNIIVWRCTATGRDVEPAAAERTEFPLRSPFHASGLLRPAVVWFGEMLPPDAIEAADEAARDCDVFMTIGTSSVVYPAAGFVEIASRCGARTIEINPEQTPASGRVTHSLRGKAGEILPSLAGQ